MKDKLSQIPSLSTSIYFCLTMHFADVNQLAGQIEPFGDGSQEKANAGGIWNPNSYVSTCRDEIIGRMVSRCFQLMQLGNRRETVTTGSMQKPLPLSLPWQGVRQGTLRMKVCG